MRLKNLSTSKKQDVAKIILSAVACALAVDFCFIPYGLAPGGLTGLSIILSSVTSIPTSIMQLMIVIPLMVFSTFIFGKGFGIKTVIITLLSSFFIQLIPVYDVLHNIVAAAIVGGVLIGCSIPLALKANAATGGTDILALLLHKVLSKISLPTIMFCIDSLIILLSGIIKKDPNVSLLSLLSLGIINIMIRFIMKGWTFQDE